MTEQKRLYEIMMLEVYIQQYHNKIQYKRPLSDKEKAKLENLIELKKKELNNLKSRTNEQSQHQSL